MSVIAIRREPEINKHLSAIIVQARFSSTMVDVLGTVQAGTTYKSPSGPTPFPTDLSQQRPLGTLLTA